jgi:predicted AlkP superfamily pyrophosphatase or phosphodiesterase
MKRVLLIAAVAAVLAASAAFALRPSGWVPDGAPTEETMATELGTAVMDHVYAGHVPGRSGEIMLVPKPHNFLLGEWDLTTLGTDTPDISTSHPNPWSYLSRVPIIAAGGDIEPGQNIDRRTAITDIAPTYAEILGMDDFQADGSVLPEVADGFGSPPKVIFSVVIDGGRWNVLQEHPDSWPFIQSLRDRGVTYSNATIGSAPSITGALHATFGTGSLPINHGIPGNQMRDPQGKNVDTWLQDADPRFLRLPTVSELWDEQNGNKPVVGTVSYEGWHLGMIGHGAQREGGDKDVAVLWEIEDDAWWINEEYYTLPSYLQTTDVARLESYESQLDQRDGLLDGTWFGHTPEELREPVARPGTPAFARFTGDAVVDVLTKEGVGHDDLTDLFWVEMKMPDFIGHAYNMEGPEEGDVIAETDRQMQRFARVLDQQVGRGNYLFVVSADHGQQPLPDLHGGWRINNVELQRDIEANFGDVIEKITPVDMYVDREAVADSDLRIGDIARYLGTYTLGDNIPEGAPGADRVPEGRLDEKLFAGAFSTDYLQGLDPEAIASFGAGIYPEGDLYSPQWTLSSRG